MCCIRKTSLRKLVHMKNHKYLLTIVRLYLYSGQLVGLPNFRVLNSTSSRLDLLWRKSALQSLGQWTTWQDHVSSSLVIKVPTLDTNNKPEKFGSGGSRLVSKATACQVCHYIGLTPRIGNTKYKPKYWARIYATQRQRSRYPDRELWSSLACSPIAV